MHSESIAFMLHSSLCYWSAMSAHILSKGTNRYCKNYPVGKLSSSNHCLSECKKYALVFLGGNRSARINYL